MRDSLLKGSLRAIVLAGAVASGACASGGPRGAVYVTTAPPPPIHERVPSPGAGHIWISGYHSWNGSRYVWVGGRWERGPHAHARWQSGHWVHSRQGWYWVDGRWR